MNKIANYYNENGFYIAKSILPKSILDDYLKDLRKIFEQQLDYLSIEYKKNCEIHDLMILLFNTNSKRYLSTLTLSGKLFSLYKTISHDKITETLEGIGLETPIWQTKPVIHCMSNELKIPNGYHGVGVHQDWPTLQSSLNNVTIWIPFTNKVTKDSFPLEVIPGTHLLGLCKGTQTEHYFETNSEYYNIKDFIPLEVELGDVIFMSNFTIHRSQTEGKDFRLSVSTRYEDASEPTFIERNYPFTEHRLVKREVLFDNFPSQEQVKKIYE